MSKHKRGFHVCNGTNPMYVNWEFPWSSDTGVPGLKKASIGEQINYTFDWIWQRADKLEAIDIDPNDMCVVLGDYRVFKPDWHPDPLYHLKQGLERERIDTQNAKTILGYIKKRNPNQ